MKRKQIAILANYPIWLIDESIPEKSGHYAVWLAANFPPKKLFSHQGVLTAYTRHAEMGAFMKRQALYEKIISRAVPFITPESEWAGEHVLNPGAFSPSPYQIKIK